MPKYQKRPVVVEAFQYTYDCNPPQWYLDAMDRGDVALIALTPGSPVSIRTPAGETIADIGDYIIQGIKGEIYPCKADIFELAYDVIEEPQMTYGSLLKRLHELDPHISVGVSRPHSYRGYYYHLAVEPLPEPAYSVIKALEDMTILRGYKGGEYYITLDTPVWVSEYGTASGHMLVAINDDGSIETREEDYITV